MIAVNKTGGATIGKANVTWPLATLKVSKDMLELDTTGLGTLTFSPHDIKSIDVHGGVLSKGLKITHTVPNYEANVIFWMFGDPIALLNKMKDIGFMK